MPKITEETLDGHAVAEASHKIAMLADLFAGHSGGSLDLSDAGIAGLCNVLREVQEVVELSEMVVCARDCAVAGGVPKVFAPRERRVN